MRAGMRVVAAAWIGCTGILLAGIETSAQSIPKETPARIELYAIPSLPLFVYTQIRSGETDCFC